MERPETSRSPCLLRGGGRGSSSRHSRTSGGAGDKPESHSEEGTATSGAGTAVMIRTCPLAQLCAGRQLSPPVQDARWKVDCEAWRDGDCGTLRVCATVPSLYSPKERTPGPGTLGKPLPAEARSVQSLVSHKTNSAHATEW